jgi:hypothetical protein
MRCYRCGRQLPDNAHRCPSCGALVIFSADEQELHRVLTTREGRSLLPGVAQTTPSPRRPLLRLPLSDEPNAVGTIISAEAPYHEPSDTRWPTVIHRVLLLAELIGLPIILLRMWLVRAGALSLFVGLTAVFLLFRYLMPVNILSTLGIIRLLNPRGDRSNQVPVRYLRVRSYDGQEQTIRAKGYVRGANLMPGDEIAAWGAIRRGTVHLRHARNLNTGATTHISFGHPLIPLILNLILLSTLIGLFYSPFLRIFSGGQQ